jgi:hypothetical protein
MRQTQLKTQRSSRCEAWGILGVRNVAAGQPVDPIVVCAWQRGSLFDRPLPHSRPLKTWEERGHVKLQVLGSATSARVVSCDSGSVVLFKDLDWVGAHVLSLINRRRHRV